MKRLKFLAVLLTAAVVFTTGCGGDVDDPTTISRDKKVFDKKDEGDDIDGADWRTWAAYIVLDWHGPDETRTYYLDISNDGGFVRIIEDEDAYSLVSTCEFSKGGVKDWDTVANSIAFEDANGDGYDDLSVTDMDGGDLINSIFLYDPEAVGFTYSEELSGPTAGQWGNNALTYDSWQDAYKDVVMVWEGDHADDELHGYKLIYLNNDDIPELALIGTEDWTVCDVYTFGDGVAYRIYEGENLDVDGRGIHYFEHSGILASSEWMAGTGKYVMTSPFDEDPYFVLLDYQLITEGETQTYIKFVEPSGDYYEQVYYGEEYDLSDLPEKENIEAALGITDLSDMRRINSEDDLMDYDEIVNALG